MTAKFCLRNVASRPSKPDTESYHPELSHELEKARKHLLQVQAAAKGSLLYQVTDLIESVGNVNDTLKVHSSSGRESEEYAMVERIFGYLQIMSACLMAFAHGANDVANAIGPLSAAITILTDRSHYCEYCCAYMGISLRWFRYRSWVGNVGLARH